jgi:hypothetical protein
MASDLDSASTNAIDKPFSKVGFVGKKNKEDTIKLSSSSEDDSSAANDSDSQSTMEGGKGG